MGVCVVSINIHIHLQQKPNNARKIYLTNYNLISGKHSWLFHNINFTILWFCWWCWHFPVRREDTQKISAVLMHDGRTTKVPPPSPPGSYFFSLIISCPYFLLKKNVILCASSLNHPVSLDIYMLFDPFCRNYSLQANQNILQICI